MSLSHGSLGHRRVITLLLKNITETKTLMIKAILNKKTVKLNLCSLNIYRNNPNECNRGWQPLTLALPCKSLRTNWILPHSDLDTRRDKKITRKLRQLYNFYFNTFWEGVSKVYITCFFKKALNDKRIIHNNLMII